MISSGKLELLKKELKLLGINYFEIDFQSLTIKINSIPGIEKEKIDCAFKKSGLPCDCWIKCKNKNV